MKTTHEAGQHPESSSQEQRWSMLTWRNKETPGHREILHVTWTGLPGAGRGCRGRGCNFEKQQSEGQTGNLASQCKRQLQEYRQKIKDVLIEFIMPGKVSPKVLNDKCTKWCKVEKDFSIWYDKEGVTAPIKRQVNNLQEPGESLYEDRQEEEWSKRRDSSARARPCEGLSPMRLGKTRKRKQMAGSEISADI